MSVRNRSRNRSTSLLGIWRNSFFVVEQPFTDKIQDYEIVSSVGVVEDISHGYVARHLPTGKYVSLKLTDLQMSSDYDLIMELVDIIRNTKLCNHPNILNYYVSFVDQERLWTVLDPINHGSLKQILIENFPNGLTNDSLVATIIKEVLKAVEYLHSNGFIHNNIRSDNIYMNSNGEVKLGGLHQMIKLFSSGKVKRSVFQFVGDPEWMAPEVLSQATTFNEKVDIYSLGITVIELAHGKTPFQGWPALKILLCKLHYEVPPIEDSAKPLSKQLTRFIERCIHKYPRLRPTSSELLEDSFLKSARNSHYMENHFVKKISSSEIFEVTPKTPDTIHPISKPELLTREEVEIK